MTRTARTPAAVRGVNRTVEVDGIRLATRCLTTGSAAPGDPVLVFLHEGLGCIEGWRDFPEALVGSTGLDGLLYDRRGYGRSDPLPEAWDRDYLSRAALEELPAVLDACSVEDPILIGHSDGGSIALIHAAHHPVSGLVTEAAHVFVEEAARSGIKRTVVSWRSGRLEPRLERYHGDKTATVFWNWADTWLAPWFDDWDIGHLLPSITCPSLLLQGREDQYATTDHLEHIAERIGGQCQSELIAECGHAPHHEAREEVLTLMERFLAGLHRAGKQPEPSDSPGGG